MRPPRPCITPGCPRLTQATRCAECERLKQAKRNASRPHLAGDWPIVSRSMLAAHRAQYGDWCPGAPDLNHPPHPCADLTVDKVIARTRAGGLRVLCRSFNSSKGTRERKT